MRLSREGKTRNHEKITSAASKMLRERGIERTSLVDLMQSVGLTHGGFYRHFKSKDELVASSAAKAFEEIAERFETRRKKFGPNAALTEYVLEYLSEAHRDNPTIGCIISACGAEASRQGELVRDAFTAGISKLLELAEDGLSCPPNKRTERAIELGGLMLGALVMARASTDAALSETILADAKRRALQIIDQAD